MLSLAPTILSLSLSASPADEPPSSVSIGLDTAVESRWAGSMGPTEARIGLPAKLQLSTVPFLWSLPLFLDDSSGPNIRLKKGLQLGAGWTASAEIAWMVLQLADLDKDGLQAKARLVPLRIRIARQWQEGLRTSFALSHSAVAAVGDGFRYQDAQVDAVAVATSTYGELLTIASLRPSWAAWLRVRSLFDQTPVTLRARTTLPNGAQLRATARNNISRLASGWSATMGAATELGRLKLRAGVGYGTWFLPFLGLPLDRDGIIGDFSLLWSFGPRHRTDSPTISHGSKPQSAVPVGAAP